MSDIVERLRNCSGHSGISYCVACKYEKDECCKGKLMTEAADEIIRLRDDLYYDYLELKEKLEAERKKHEKLANENKELRDERDVDHDANIALDSALEEERKKQEWTSIKDKGWQGKRVVAIDKYDCAIIGSIGYDEKYNCFVCENDEEQLCYITYYLPLPEPPKEDEDE